jgi:hypothetical protein
MLLPLLLLLAAVPASDAGQGPGGAPPTDATRLPFTPDTVRQVVLAAQPRIQACYEDRMVANRRSPQGTLRTSWVIGPSGLVKRARVDWKASTLKDRPLHDCVVGVLSAMVFPPPPDGKDHPVEFPFNLQAQH